MKLRRLVTAAVAAAACALTPVAAAHADNAAPVRTDHQVTAAAVTAPSMSVTASSPYSNIRATQFLLNAWGVPTSADGKFGPKTTASIKSYQAKHGLAVDGSAGPKTMTSLTSTTGFAGSPNVNTTKAVQQLLVKLGYKISVDGSFGPATTSAVKSWQSKIKVSQTGRVDATTWAFLFSPPPPPPGSWKKCSDSIDSTNRKGLPSSQTTSVQSDIRVASCLAPSVRSMIASARSAGISLHANSSYRSHQSQISLRRQNCGTSYYDIYQKPASQCSPNTAIPGTSIHEYGLAIDFNVSSSSTYNWLIKNGPKYGFYRTVASERWHFDTKQKPLGSIYG
ncbi:peptidoglycan-binding protein [Microlunatus soli]|uniref:Peptidoglycan-binding (PGRP) domain of peptidoglycan hydrolases-containing protein n=1 Tax=Microlunatus soli TaxID=630515 RepID=A0A1H1VNI8_9ACTN|nr:peptidoglycan-binding protein [Microlunatus soli]SDS86504.1 Peptidoglycan-binding (PGRP) domain of peptidoglycan hydrolases-containing protein [Microlunatus soli]